MELLFKTSIWLNGSYVFVYQYFGVFDPDTIPIAGPEWIPIRSWRREFGIWGILKTIEAHKRSNAIDAIS